MTDAKSVHPVAGAGMSHPVLSAPVVDRSGFQGSTGAPPSGRCGGVPLDAALLRWLFSSTVPGTEGFEEELLLVHRGSWLPADAAAVAAGIGDLRVKPELLACQLEIATSVHEDVAGAVEELRSCRALLAAACGPDLAAISAPVHPLLGRPTALSATERAVGLGARYREVIGRQLVSSLQVHPAFGGADCTLGVYHALRDLLPELAALAGPPPSPPDATPACARCVR